MLSDASCLHLSLSPFAGMFTFPGAHVAYKSRCNCPVCEERCVQTRISGLISALPPPMYERVFDFMIKPFLLSLCELVPSLFPARWVSDPPPQALHVSAYDVRDAAGTLLGHLSLRILFMEMCRSIHRVSKSAAAAADWVDITRLVDDVTVAGINIYARLISRRRFFYRRGLSTRDSFRVCVERINAHIQSIQGVDIVFHRLQMQVEKLNSCRPPSYTPVQMYRFACHVGRVEHMAYLAVRFRDECALSGRGKRYLNQLILLLQGVLIAEIDTRLALAMALHSRLGAEAGIAALGCDLLPLCIPSREGEPIVFWHDLV